MIDVKAFMDTHRDEMHSAARAGAYVAGVFSAVVAAFIMISFIQHGPQSPIVSPDVDVLVDTLSKDPNNGVLKGTIRSLDLLVRKAYFAGLAFSDTGAILLLAGVAVFLLLLAAMNGLRPEKASLGAKPDAAAAERVRARSFIAVASAGAAIAVVAFIVPRVMYAPASASAKTPPSAAATNIPAMPAAAAVTNTKAAAAFVAHEVLIKQWPNFRGPYGHGIAYGASPALVWDGAAGKNIKWKTAVPLEGKSSPIVWGSKVFLTGSDGEKRSLYCINADTGALLWQLTEKFGAEVEASDDTGYAASTPAADGERVYAVFSSGDLIAADMNGKKVWSRSFGVPGLNYGYASSLIVHRYLFVQIDSEEGGVLHALDTATGKTVWSKKRKYGASWSSPIIVVSGGREAVVLTANPAVTAYAVSDGTLLFAHACLSGEVAPSAGFSRGIVVAGAEFSTLTAIGFPGGAKKWSSEDDLPNASSPLASGAFVVTLNASGAVNCYDIAAGKKHWHHEFDAEFFASPISAGGNVYCMANDGSAKVVTLTTEFAEAGSGALGEKSSSTPAVVGTRIFIRGDKHLFCIAP